MIASIALLSFALVDTGASTTLRTADKKESFGAVVGPASLPAGATAAYAFLALPELGAGFRAGPSFESEASACRYLTPPLHIGELIGKYALYHLGAAGLRPYLGAGITFSLRGARYYDPLAFPFRGVRVLGGADAQLPGAGHARPLSPA